MYISAILAHEDRIHSRLHIIVDAPGAGPDEEGESLIVGIKNHLLRLAGVSPDKRHPAVAQANMRNLHRHGCNKIGRLAAQSPKLEQGQVRLPRLAIWREAFLSECAAIPYGKYDDQVDSMSQLLRTLDYGHGTIKHCSRFKG